MWWDNGSQNGRPEVFFSSSHCSLLIALCALRFAVCGLRFAVEISSGLVRSIPVLSVSHDALKGISSTSLLSSALNKPTSAILPDNFIHWYNRSF